MGSTLVNRATSAFRKNAIQPIVSQPQQAIASDNSYDSAAVACATRVEMARWKVQFAPGAG